VVQVLDNPGDVAGAIFKRYESRGFEPSAKECDLLLEL